MVFNDNICHAFVDLQFEGRHDIQHNGTQHNNTQHIGLVCDTQQN